MTKVKRKSWGQKLKKFFLYSVIIILLIFLIIYIALNITYVKNYIAQKYGIEYINKTYGTKIFAEDVIINWKQDVVLYNLTIKDHKNFHFIKADKLILDISLYDLFGELYNKHGEFHQLKMNQIRLINPEMKAITYKGEDKDNFTIFIDKFDDGKPKSTIPFVFEGNINIENGKLDIINQNTIENSTWLESEKFNLKVTNFKVVGSDFSAIINNLSFKAKRHNEAYELSKMTSNFSYSDKKLHFDNLKLITQSSVLNGKANFNYNDTQDFSNFINKVNWDFDILDGSTISGKDIRYFNEKWDNNNIAKISTQIKGTLNNLQLENVKLSSNRLLLQAKKLILDNILEEFYTIHTENAIVNFTENSLKNILPSSISQKINNKLTLFKTIDYRGNATINPNVIIAKGDFTSSLGFMNINGNIRGYSTNVPQYKAVINAKNVNLFPITHSNFFGTFSGNLDLLGKGFDVEYLDTTLNAKISSINLSGFNLQNVIFDGGFTKKIINGELKSNNNFVKLNANGIFNLQNPKQYIAVLKADIKHIYLTHFKLSKENAATYSGIIDADVKFSTLEDLVGKLTFTNSIYQTSKQAIAIENLYIDTQINNKQRELYINSPSFIEGNVKGNYRLDDLPEMLKNGIGNLLVGYIPKRNFKDKNIVFDFKIEDEILNIFIPDLILEKGSYVHGNYQGEGNNLELIINATNFYYDGINAKNVDVNLDTKNPINQLKTKVSELIYKDQIFSDIDVNAYKRNDSLFSDMNFKLGKEKSQIFDINLYQIRNKDFLEVGFANSSILINGIDWKLNPTNNIETNKIIYNIKTQQATFKDIEVKTGESTILANGNYLNNNNFNIQALINNVYLEKFIPQDILGDSTLKGKLSGGLNIVKNNQVFEPNINFTVDDLILNEYPLGTLNSLIVYDNISKLYNINTDISKDNNINLNITGTIDNNKEKPELDLKSHFNNFQMGVAGNFLKKVLSNFRGTASGDVNFTGSYNKLAYNGGLELQNFGFTVDYLGVDYLFDEKSYISLNGDSNGLGSINIDNLPFTETLSNTHGIVYGSIFNKKFEEWYLELSFDNIEKNNNEANGLLVLNTTSKQNDLFYGAIYSQGNISLSGEVSELKISVDEGKVLKKSKFYLNANATSNVNETFTFIRFINNTTDSIKTKINKKPTGISIDMKLDIEDGTQAKVIIDDKNDSYLEAYFKSDNLHFEMLPSGEMKVNGTLESSNGIYQFGLLPGVSRQFQLERNSTIQWNGNPLNPDINVTAIFKQVVSNVTQFLNLPYQVTEEANLIIKLKNTLQEPDLDFDIIMPKANSEIRDGLVQKLNSQEIKFAQVSAIIVIKQFSLDETSLSGFSSTAYSIALKQMVGFLNTISSNVQFGLDYISSDKSAISDKVIFDQNININNKITIKNILGIPLGKNSSSTEIVTFNVSVEYDISKRNDKSTVLRAFSRPSSFGSENYALDETQNNQIYGGGIVWRKSFNSFFNTKKNKTPLDSLSIKKDSILLK